MKKKALATFLSVCMLATVAVPTAIVSATTDSGDAGTSSNQPTEQKSITVTKDESSAQFDSLEDALAAAEEGSTITLNENITVTQRAYITKGITLNGNGHSIAGVGDFSSSSNPAVVLIDTDNAVVLSDLSIIGGTSNKFPLNIYTSPNVTLNNVSVTNVFTNGGAMLVLLIRTLITRPAAGRWRAALPISPIFIPAVPWCTAKTATASAAWWRRGCWRMRSPFRSSQTVSICRRSCCG